VQRRPAVVGGAGMAAIGIGLGFLNLVVFALFVIY
jgi:hypothetical protein